jgi:membrane protease YdiL (CAAX protease family)
MSTDDTQRGEMSVPLHEAPARPTARTGLRAPLFGPAARRLVFLATFLGAWYALDALVTSPPNPVSATLALASAAAVLALGQRCLGVPWRRILASLGLGRPVLRAVAVAGVVGSAVFLCLPLGAHAVGATVELRQNWPSVLVAVLLFHGLAEELVWRGFVFGHLRRTTTFWRAIAGSVPLIALTHVPIVASDGLAIGTFATLTAAVTCLPFAYLWERGGGTIWAPALLHGLIGTWQLFERPYPTSFSAVILTASIVVPLAVFLFRDRFFHEPAGRPVRRRLHRSTCEEAA